ncbi:hypothetical protein ACSBR1_041026 [Camellia fascicularis]
MEEETPSQITLFSPLNLSSFPPHLSLPLPLLQAHFRFSHLHPKKFPPTTVPPPLHLPENPSWREIPLVHTPQWVQQPIV